MPSCRKCEEARFGGSCRCGDCVRVQDLAIVKFLNGEGDLHSVVSSFGVDCARESVKAASMESALMDAKSDILRLRQPVDLCREVERLREELWKAAEG